MYRDCMLYGFRYYYVPRYILYVHKYHNKGMLDICLEILTYINVYTQITDYTSMSKVIKPASNKTLCFIQPDLFCNIKSPENVHNNL